MYFSEYVICCPHYNGFEFQNDFFGTHGPQPVKPGPRAAKPIGPPARRTSKIIIDRSKNYTYVNSLPSATL